MSNINIFISWIDKIYLTYKYIHKDVSVVSEKPRRYLFDILADEEYKRRYKIKQGEINEDDNFA